MIFAFLICNMKIKLPPIPPIVQGKVVPPMIYGRILENEENDLYKKSKNKNKSQPKSKAESLPKTITIDLDKLNDGKISELAYQKHIKPFKQRLKKEKTKKRMQWIADHIIDLIALLLSIVAIVISLLK